MPATYEVKIGQIECAYYNQVDTLANFGSLNKETLGELVLAFFEYWAFRHDYNRAVISVRTGSILRYGETQKCGPSYLALQCCATARVRKDSIRSNLLSSEFPCCELQQRAEGLDKKNRQ